MSKNQTIRKVLRRVRPYWGHLALSLVFTAVSVWSAAKLALNQETELWKKIIAITVMCILVAGFLEPYLFITNVYYHVTDFVFFFLTGYLDHWANRK